MLAAAVVLAPDIASAETSNCDSRVGSCEVSNDFDDSFSCECADGAGGFGGGGNEWEGLSQAELDAVCLETLDLLCGEGPPPSGVDCETRDGSCNVDNEPDSVSCECADGSGGFGGGGNDWDGLSDEELFDVCIEQIDFYCGPVVPPEWDCENDFGSCDLDVDEPSYFCGCSNGGGGGGPGDPGWVDLDEDDLQLACLETISEVCGGPPPTTTGESETDDGATDDAATDDATTLETGTDDASDDTNDDTNDDASDGATTGDVDPTDDDASASASASASMTDGETVTDGNDDSSGDGAGADGNDDASGCSCDASGRNHQGLFGLALLGLLGLRRRRR